MAPAPSSRRARGAEAAGSRPSSPRGGGTRGHPASPGASNGAAHSSTSASENTRWAAAAGRRQRLERGRAPPHWEGRRRRPGRGEAGQAAVRRAWCRSFQWSTTPATTPVSTPVPRIAAAATLPDPPGERRAEQAPGVDAVRPERDQQHRDHRAPASRRRGAPSRRRRRTPSGPGSRTPKTPARSSTAAFAAPPSTCETWFRTFHGKDLDQDRPEDAGEEHQRERGDDHPPEVADVVEHHPSQRAHGPGRRWPLPLRRELRRAEEGLELLEERRARAVVTRPAARGTSRGARRAARARAPRPGR